MRSAIAFLVIVCVLVVQYRLKKDDVHVRQLLQPSAQKIQGWKSQADQWLEKRQKPNSKNDQAIALNTNEPSCEEFENGNDDGTCATQQDPDKFLTENGEMLFSIGDDLLAKRRLHPLAPLFEQTTPPSQYYEINNQKASTIKGKNGMVVSIPKNCFVTDKGIPVEGKVQIEMKELFSTSELLLANLPTSTDDNLFVSDGAFYIEAQSGNGKKLQINSNKWIYVETPTTSEKTKKRPYTDVKYNGENLPSGYSLLQSNFPRASIAIVYALPTAPLPILVQLFVGQILSSIYPQTPAAAAAFSGREVFEKLKEYDPMLQKMDTLPDVMPIINFEDSLRKTMPNHRSTRQNAYVITRTGWTNINHAKPINKPRKSMGVQVIGSANLQSSVFLVFRDFRAIISGRDMGNGKFLFSGVPINEKAYLVGLGYRNNQPYIDIADVSSSTTEQAKLSLRATTFDMLKYQISQLNY